MISIIIPAYNRHDMTRDCIQAVLDKTPGCEIVLVDNGSTPSLESALPPGLIDVTTLDSPGREFVLPRDAGFITYRRNKENLGFPAAVNQGILAASGDTIILLNNDVIVTPGWAERLTGWLAFNDFVAPTTNYCAGMQRVTLPAYHDGPELDRRAREWSEKNDGQAIRVNWVIGFCMAFRRETYAAIGPFDESLWPCSGEEIDFCLRIIKAGGWGAIARDVYVHHFGSQTFADMQRDGQIQYNEIVDRNNRHLAEKWGESWVKQAV